MNGQSSQNGQQYPRCPKCGSRLFQESEYLGDRLFYFWECSLGCSRQYTLDGKSLSYKAGEHRVRIVRELALAR